MSNNSGNVLFSQKKAPAGCPDSKTKVVNIFWNIPDSIQTKLYLKNYIFIENSSKITNFQLNLLFNGVGGMAGGLKLLRYDIT